MTTPHTTSNPAQQIADRNRIITKANAIIDRLVAGNCFHSAKEGIYGVEITRKAYQFGGGFGLFTQIIPWEESK